MLRYAIKAEEKQSAFKASEWNQIIAVLGLATVTLFGIGVLFQSDPRKATTLLSTIGMHAAGARAPAILFCLVRGLSPVLSLLFNFYVEVIIVFLCYYSFVLLIREGIETKFLHLAAKAAEENAQKHRNMIKRFELVGLFFLVIAPLPMTGPVSGAIVGYLMNIKPWVTFSVVLAATFLANLLYVLLGKAVLSRLIDMQHQYQDAATILIAILIAGFTIFHVRSIASWVQSVSDKDVEA